MTIYDKNGKPKIEFDEFILIYPIMCISIILIYFLSNGK